MTNEQHPTAPHEGRNAELVRRARLTAKGRMTAEAMTIRDLADALEASERRTVHCGQHTSATEPHEPSDMSACWGCYCDALHALGKSEARRQEVERYWQAHTDVLVAIRKRLGGHPDAVLMGEHGLLERALAAVPSAEAVGAVRRLIEDTSVQHEPNDNT